MLSHLSTSSSELGPCERVASGRVPVAAIAFLCCLVVVESFAQTHREWFADLSMWHWEIKRALLDAGHLDGDVMIFGTSVLMSGLDPNPANAVLSDSKVVNLALNGMMLQHQAQLLREIVLSNKAPAVAVIEFRQVVFERDDWIRGPYFTFWSSFPEFAESRFYYWNPAVGLTFAAHRLFATFRYREAINQWIFESLRARRPVRTTFERNRRTTLDMRVNRGAAPASFEAEELLAYGLGVSPRYEGFEVNADGTYSLWFGYQNRNRREELHIPVGPENSVQPGGDRGQPTHFLPGRDKDVFRVVVPSDFGKGTIAWKLKVRTDTDPGWSDEAVGRLGPRWQMPAPPRTRQWRVNAAGELWLSRFLDLAAQHQIEVVLLVPPSPPYLREEDGPAGFRHRFAASVSRIRQQYPRLDVQVYEPRGFDRGQFADDLHLTASGRLKLSTDFAEWMKAREAARKPLKARTRDQAARSEDVDVR